MPKRRKSLRKEQILKHLELQSKSGKTVEDYCERNDLGKSTFFRWRSRYGYASVGRNGEFVELTPENNVLNPVAELTFSGGRLQFYPGAGSGLISKIIKSL